MINALQDSCTTNNSRLPSEVVQQPLVQATFLVEESSKPQGSKRCGTIPISGRSRRTRWNPLLIAFSALARLRSLQTGIRIVIADSESTLNRRR
jgi:hypothetical protein